MPRVPDEWCPSDRGYHQHVRLQDEGIAGATFGVADQGTLDWIPPERAGCVDWTRMGPSMDFTKDVIMQFRLQRPLPGALLWVLDGDTALRGRLYEVDASGTAHYITGGHWDANQEHFRDVWRNVMPVSASQILDFDARGLVGADQR